MATLTTAKTSLAGYRKKQNFNRTPEPIPAKKKSGVKGLMFFVQKHQASNLHDDFRFAADLTSANAPAE